MINMVTVARRVAMVTDAMKIVRQFIKDEEKIARTVKAVAGYQMMLWKRLIAISHNEQGLANLGL